MRPRHGSVLVLTAATLAIGAAPAAADTVYGVTGERSPHLVTFDSAAPGTFTSDVEITGLPAGRTIVGIDTRPATSGVVALDDAGQLHALDPFSGALKPIGTPSVAGATDIDFNPTVDRLRVVGQGGGTGNARVNPNTGGLAATDGPLAFAPSDPNAGDAPVVPATAYTNAFPASQTSPAAPTTAQFDLEAGNDVLVRQAPPNDGTLNTVGPLGVDLEGPAGFDVVTDADGTTNRAWAAFGVAGSDTTGFYAINTGTGAATEVDDFPADRPVTDIAVQPQAPLLVALVARAGGGQALTRFGADRPRDAGSRSAAVSGLPKGVRLLGIDQRPATGGLYGLGSDSRIYLVDPVGGAVEAVGASPFTPALRGSSFGFDFNPVADRIRVVSDNGQNLRINPDTGVGAVTPPDAADGDLNGASSSATGAAYTNSTRPAPATTALLDIDSRGGTLLSQVANPGTTSVIGPLAPAGSGVMGVGDANGYDIAARFNQGFAASGGVLLAVNAAGGAGTPANGSTSVIGTLGDGGLAVEGLAVLDPGLATPPAGTQRARVVTERIQRDTEAPFEYTVRGRIEPRGAVSASAFDTGRVQLQVRRVLGARTLATRTARVTQAGVFEMRVTVPEGRLPARSGFLRVTLRFGGTAELTPAADHPLARYR